MQLNMSICLTPLKILTNLEGLLAYTILYIQIHFMYVCMCLSTSPNCKITRLLENFFFYYYQQHIELCQVYLLK